VSEYVYAGLTSQTIDVFLRDSSSATGAGLTGLVYNSSGLKAYYRKGATGTATQITLATQTAGGAWSSGGFVAVDGTNLPGIYRLDLPDAMVDTEGFVTLHIYGAANLQPTPLRIDCRALPADLKKIGASAVNTGTAQIGVNVVTYASGQAPPSASTNATAVRTELTTELNRIDATISSRLATASYTTPPTVGAIADAVWDEAYNQHTTAGTFGKLMDTLRKANNIIEGTILATPTPTTTVFRISGADYPTGALEHAVLWMGSGASENQNSSILTTLNNGDGTVTVTLEEALVTAPSAGDTVLIDPTSHVHAIADIQAGLATAANLLIVSDRVSYSLAVLVGACSDAQTAAETYTLTIGGNTFTVDYTGLDSSGNRSTTTLSKT